MTRMPASPRTRRLAYLGAALTVTLASAAAILFLLPHGPSGPATAQRVQVAHTEASHAAIAPLLVEPLVDASGSTRSTDPTGRRFRACDEVLSAIEAARPPAARTLVAPIFFGSRSVALAPYRLGDGYPARRLSFDGNLGNTDFAAALTRATEVARGFLSSPRAASARVVAIILTDGVPDLGDGRPAAALWPGIGRSVARLRATGAELYLLGVTDSSGPWRAAAVQWRRLLGAAHVRLVNSIFGLSTLSHSFAETALEVGAFQGARLDPGKSLSLRAGNFTAAFTIQATALAPRASVAFRSTAGRGPVRATLASRGDQRTWQVSAEPHNTLVVRNTGSAPVQVVLRADTAVLDPMDQPNPSLGAPIDAYVMSLRGGSGLALRQPRNDPLTLSAVLTSPGRPGPSAASAMQLTQFAPGTYLLSAPGRWSSGAYRLTVLTRSASGEVGRADYEIDPQSQPWASLRQPAHLTNLADASSVRLNVRLFLDESAVRPERVSSSGNASVLAQLCDLSGRVRASVWMAEAGDGSLTASVPAVVHDGLLKLSVIDKRGRIVSTRPVLWRMRATLAQTLVSRASLVALVLAIGIILCALALSLWIVLKPSLPGALVVTGAERPLRLELMGRKCRLARLSDAVGTSRWFILPASRSSLLLVRLGIHPRSTIIHRGRETAFDGRSVRLV